MFLDTLLFIISKIFPYYKLIFMDIFTCIGFFVFYSIIVYKDNNIFKKTKFRIIAILLVMILLCTFVIIDVLIIKQKNYINIKYKLNSYMFKTENNNLDFIFAFNNMILDTAIGFVFIIIHFIANNNIDTIELAEKFTQKASKFLIRVFALMGITGIIISTKMFIFSYPGILGVKKEFSSENSYENNMFSVEYQTLNIERNNKKMQVFTCFNKTRYTVFYNGSFIKDIYTVVYPKKVEKTNKLSNIVEMDDGFEHYIIDGLNIQFLNKQIVCYVDEGLPKVIYLNKINNCKKNEKLLRICEELLNKGNINIFEYVCDYIYKYDKIYFDNLIRRYKYGKFTPEEIKNLNDLDISLTFIKGIVDKF